MKKRRILSAFLALMMLFSLSFPTVYAEDFELFEDTFVEENYWDEWNNEAGFEEELIFEDEEYPPEDNFDYIQEEWTEEPYFEEIDEFFDEDVLVDENTMEEFDDVSVEEAADPIEEAPDDVSVEDTAELTEKFVISDTEVFDAGETLAIVTEPKNFIGDVGSDASFEVKATGVASYQWQYSYNGTKWYAASGASSKTALFTTQINETRYTLIYRCLLKDGAGNELTTQNVRIINPNAFAIVTEPEDFTGEIGSDASFAVEATGVASYQWQYSYNGTKWYAASGASSKTALFTTQINETRYTLIYRCLLKDEAGNELTTKSVHILKPVSFEIVTEPEDYTGEIGELASFEVEATGAASYQWQYSSDGKTWRSASGAGNKTAKMDIEINATRYTLQFRCLLKDEAGNELTTKSVRIISPTIELNNVVYKPIDATTCMVVAYNGSLASVTIPETVEGMTVTEIGVAAFKGNTVLESIDLPDTITVIRAEAFKNCTSLREMH